MNRFLSMVLVALLFPSLVSALTIEMRGIGGLVVTGPNIGPGNKPIAFGTNDPNNVTALFDTESGDFDLSVTFGGGSVHLELGRFDPTPGAPDDLLFLGGSFWGADSLPFKPTDSLAAEFPSYARGTPYTGMMLYYTGVGFIGGDRYDFEGRFLLGRYRTYETPEPATCLLFGLGLPFLRRFHKVQ